MPVEVDERNAATVVTLAWETQRNALGPREAREVAEAVTEASQRPAVSCVVLTGRGAFCSGGNLREFAAISASQSVSAIRGHVYGDVQAIIRALVESPVPTLAAVDGPAVGLGMDLALACDMRFIGPKGWLMQGWARAGLIAGTGGVVLLQRLNSSLLWRLLADQPRLGADECERYGLGEAAPNGALEAALQRAHALAAIDRRVLEAYVRLQRGDPRELQAHLEASADLQAEFIGSAEFRQLAERLLSAR